MLRLTVSSPRLCLRHSLHSAPEDDAGSYGAGEMTTVSSIGR